MYFTEPLLHFLYNAERGELPKWIINGPWFSVWNQGKWTDKEHVIIIDTVKSVYAGYRNLKKTYFIFV